MVRGMHSNNRMLHRFLLIFSLFLLALIICSFLYYLSPQNLFSSVKASEIEMGENINIVSISDQLDQSQQEHKDLYYGSKNNGELIQSFTPTVNTLTRVYLYGWQNGDAPGNLTISIRETLTGDPLSITYLQPSDIPLGENNADWFEVDIQDINIFPNSTYYIVWKPDFDNKGISYYWWFDYYRSIDRPENDAYTKGAQYRQGTMYPLNDFCFMTYGFCIPTIIVESPAMNDIIYSKTVISGNADDKDGTIQKVEINIDNKCWNEVNGTNEWFFEWDTTQIINGEHKISVRSYDGQSYSTSSSITVTVSNTRLDINWITGGDGRISTEIKNEGPVDAYNVSCSITIKNIFTRKTNVYSIEGTHILNPEETKIISQEIEKKFAIISLVLRVNAENANSYTLVTYGFVLGHYILVL